MAVLRHASKRASSSSASARKVSTGETAKASLSTTQYWNDASKILPCFVDVQASDRDTQLLRVATAFCPFLRDEEDNDEDDMAGNDNNGLLNGNANDDDDDDDQKSSASNDSNSASSSSSFPINPVCPLDRSVSLSSMASFRGRGDRVSIKELHGGMSNDLFLVQRRHYSVLVRVHPEIKNNLDDQDAASGNAPSDTKIEDDTVNDDEASQDSVVNRDVENELVAWLSKQGLAPGYYGRFQNGRVEEFYQNVVPLSCHDMPAYGPQVAAKVAEFHAQAMPHKIVPFPDHPLGGRAAGVDKWFASILSGDADVDGSLSVLNNSFLANDTAKVLPAFTSALYREWQWLQDHLQEVQRGESRNDNDDNTNTRALSFIREIVLTHMDCQSLNILRDADGNADNGNTAKSIRLIDFEYADWNPRAADIANTFCEYCDMNNLKADYEREYPSIADQNTFLTAYAIRAGWAEEEINEDVLSIWRREVGRFALLSHLGWMAWAVVMYGDGSAGVEDCDYLAYARHRLVGYRHHKALFGNI